MNIDQIRQDFPLLTQKSHGRTIAYLDNAATSAKPRSVMEAEMAYYQEFGVNIHRGLYELSATATRRFQETREQTATFIGAAQSQEIIFTHGSTESSNLLAASWGGANLGPGKVVLTTELEHHSTLIPWQQICQKTGAELRLIPYDAKSGALDLSGLNQLLTDVVIVVISAMTNATGYRPPIKTIIQAAHAKGALVCLDAAQFACHQTLNVQDLDCDFLYFSAHKMLGPTGLGVLYGKADLLAAMPPIWFGGDMVDQVSARTATWAEVPAKFEAGTPNIAGVIGFSAALNYLSQVGMNNIAAHEERLIAYALDQAQSLPELTVYGPLDRANQGGIVSCNLAGIHCHDLGTILDSLGVAIRSGFHCAMPYMQALGTGGTARASFYLYTTFDEIDRFFDGIRQAKTLFS